MLTKQQSSHLRKVRFTKGMIVRISLTDFVTYDSIELNAYPKLNMILGPNGTGKSTFLCAVVLGLGGKPSIIGRSPHVSDYIKRGKEKATVELELFNPDGRNTVITRTIFPNNKSHWTLQRKAVPLSQIEELLAQNNIMVNNLCQMLPQDRVQDFAKMDRKQLLEATQKAVDTDELFQWYQQLKLFRTDLLNDGQDLDELKKKFDVESQKLKSMEGEVKSYAEKQAILAKVENMRKKEAWLQFEEKNEHRAQVHGELQELSKVLEKLSKKLSPHLNAIKKHEATEQDLSSKLRAKETILQEVNQKINSAVRSGEGTKATISTLLQELESKLKSLKDKSGEIETLRSRRESFLAQVPKMSENFLKTGIFVADKQIEKGKQELSVLASKHKEIEARRSHTFQAVKANEHHLAKLSSAADKKFERLATFKDAHEGYKWLNDNRSKFSGHIYGPMFIELNVSSENKTKYVERIIPRADLIAFVCEDSKDMTKLLSILKGEKGLQINAVTSVPSDVPAKECFLPRLPLNHISPLGFTNYLLDVIDGPDPILHYLCKMYNLHNIPIGTAAVEKVNEKIPKEINVYFSTEKIFRTRQSRFSSNVLTSIEYVQDADLLTSNTTSLSLISSIKEELAAKTQLLESIDEELAEMSQLRQQTEVESNQAKNQKRDLARQLEYLRTSNVRIKMIDEEIEKLEQNNDSPEGEEAKTAAQIVKRLESLTKNEKTISAYLKQTNEIKERLFVTKNEIDIVVCRIKERQKLSGQIKLETEHAKRSVELKQDELSRVRAEAKVLLQKAKAATNGLATDDPEFVRTFKADFQQFANTLDALRNEIGEQEALARCLQDAGSSSVMAEYEERKKLLGRLEATLSNKTMKRSTLQQRSMELKEKWLPKMQNLVRTINDKFEKCFEYLGCCGTIELDLTENPDAVENYGLNIKVKFRNEGGLQALNPFTQSGGERSLSTAVYLLSLQSVINVPFRFVDEINQGMDAANEVRVYYLIMCAVSQEKSAQYFLISPKFIEDTKISLDTVVQVIYSAKNTTEEGNSTSVAEWSEERYFKAIGLNV